MSLQLMCVLLSINVISTEPYEWRDLTGTVSNP